MQPGWRKPQPRSIKQKRKRRYKQQVVVKRLRHLAVQQRRKRPLRTAAGAINVREQIKRTAGKRNGACIKKIVQQQYRYCCCSNAGFVQAGLPVNHTCCCGWPKTRWRQTETQQ